MPDLPEPVGNAALVLEEAGRLPEAAARYEEALAIDPTFPPVLANAARCLRKLDDRAGEPSLRTAELLREVAFRDERPQSVPAIVAQTGFA